MSLKFLVLRRVENFHQRRRGVAAEIAAELVDFVEHQQRIADAGAPHRLNDAARHRTDVSAAMAAQFGFVVQAAERQPFEFATHRARDRLAERRLADAGRTDEADDRRFRFLVELHHREAFEDAIL